MYYVYILKGPKQFYTGYTENLSRRLERHATDTVFSTKHRGPWRLVYYEACESGADALLREKYLKTAWGKRYIKNRIKHAPDISQGKKDKPAP